MEKTICSTHPELKAITLKATSLEPSNRFKSAHEVQSDIYNFTKDFPVVSFNGDIGYRLRKAIKRNPWEISIASIVSMFILGAGLFITNQKLQLLSEKARKAELATFITSMYEAADPSKKNPGEEITAMDLLKASIDAVKSDSIEGHSLRTEVVNHLVATVIGLGRPQEAREIMQFHPCNKEFQCDNDQNHYDFFRLNCSLYRELGKDEQRIEYCRKALALTTDNREKFSSISSILMGYYGLDNLEAVKLWNQQAEELAREINEGDTWASFYVFQGQIFERESKYPQAIEYFRKAVEIAKGDSTLNNKLAGYSSNLAYVLELNGDYKEAEKNYREALRLDKLRYGENHVETALSMHFLAMFLDTIGKFDESIEFYNKSIEINKTVFETEANREFANLYNNRGLTYLHKRDFVKAEPDLLKALEININLYGENHRNVVSNYTGLSALYQQIGDLKKAYAFHMKSLSIVKKIYSPTNQVLANQLNNLSLILEKQGKYDEALESLNKSLDIALTNLSKDSLGIAQRYNNFATIYKSMKQYDKAIEFIRKTIAIFEKHNINSTNLARHYNELASLQLWSSDAENAYVNQLKAIEMESQLNEATTTNSLIYCVNMASIEERREHFTEAKEWVERCEGDILEKFDPDHALRKKLEKFKIKLAQKIDL